MSTLFSKYFYFFSHFMSEIVASPLFMRVCGLLTFSIFLSFFCCFRYISFILFTLFYNILISIFYLSYTYHAFIFHLSFIYLSLSCNRLACDIYLYIYLLLFYICFDIFYLVFQFAFNCLASAIKETIYLIKYFTLNEPTIKILL